MVTVPKKAQKPAPAGQAVTWDEFSAFGDLAELEHVCELLRDRASENCLLQVRLDSMTAEGSLLDKRLQQQARETKAMLEAERPGLYPRTWMAELFLELFARLDAVTSTPEYLSDNIPWLCEALHKVLIAAHEVFEPSHRATLVAKALSSKASLAAAKSHSGRAELRNKACAAFMEGGPWDSIAAAVEKIEPTLTECRTGSRPLSKANAKRTVREWLSNHIKNTPAAMAKLTEAAQKRIKKAQLVASNRSIR